MKDLNQASQPENSAAFDLLLDLQRQVTISRSHRSHIQAILHYIRNEPNIELFDAAIERILPSSEEQQTLKPFSEFPPSFFDAQLCLHDELLSVLNAFKLQDPGSFVLYLLTFLGKKRLPLFVTNYLQ
jgi:hypothetical protein